MRYETIDELLRANRKRVYWTDGAGRVALRMRHRYDWYGVPIGRSGYEKIGETYFLPRDPAISKHKAD